METKDIEVKSRERRDALRKIGLMAAYTAPAMTVMLASKKGNAGDLSGRDYEVE